MYKGVLYGSGGSDDSGENHRELTQAEYNALSEAEKKDGTVYFITDGVSDTVFVDDPNPIGAIQAYGGSTAPYGWLICDGRAVSRTTYSELFAVIGTTYGSGDGTSTFNLPDLKGRVIVGESTSYTLGSTGGAATVTLSHDNAGVKNASVEAAGFGLTAATAFQNRVMVTNSTTTAHNNMQPYIVANYIIKAKDGGSVKPAILELIDTFYPVGSYYETTDTTFDPNIAWGGAWSLETEGQVHISGGSNYTVGNEYGRNETTLNANIGAANNNSASLGYITNAPTAYQHAHSANYVIQGSAIGFSGWNHSTPVTEESVNSKNVSMMQKSIAVNRWHRTA